MIVTIIAEQDIIWKGSFGCFWEIMEVMKLLEGVICNKYNAVQRIFALILTTQ